MAEPKLHVDNEATFLWARVTGRLPTVPGSLYSPPYVANHSDYDVRCVAWRSLRWWRRRGDGF